MSQLSEYLDKKVVIPTDEYKELHLLYLTVKGYINKKNDIYLDEMQKTIIRYENLKND